ncbi:MAG: outer membrane beta-barrel protein [Saprospiraceae bacterium]
MKNILLLILVVILPLALWAQLTPGTKYIGGGMNVSFSQENDVLLGRLFNNSTGLLEPYYGTTKQTYASFNTGLGVFITPNGALGARVGYSYRQTKSNADFDPLNPFSSFTYKDHSFYIAPFYRRNLPLSERLGAFLDMSCSVGLGSSRNRSDNTEVSKSRSFSLQPTVAPGIYFFLSDRFLVETNLGALYYSRQRIKPENADARTSNQISFSFTNGIFLALQYYFGGKA